MKQTADADNRLEAQRLELLRRKLAERGLAPAGPPQLDEAATDELSDGQRRMWFLQSVDPSGALLNVPVSYRITGALDAERLRAAVDAVAVAHPILRTTYYADTNGEPRQRVHDDLRPGWTEHDLSERSEHARRLRLEVLAQREFTGPFDLSADAPLRISLVRLAPQEHVLLLVAHHIAWDDGSWRVFFSDLTRAYAGAQLHHATVASPRVPAESAAADVDYWRTVLADLPEPLELPGPTGSAVPTSWRSALSSRRLPAATAQRIAQVARDNGATPYMVLLSVFGLLLHRYTHSDDFLVASPVINRDATTENAIGYFGNTVAMRLRPNSSITFRDMLIHTRDTAIGAFSHQRVNLDRVVRELSRELRVDRRHGAERLTRVSFGFREPDDGVFNPAGVSCVRADLRGHLTQLPLEFMAEFDAGADGGVLIEVEHQLEILEPALGRQLLDHFVVLLDSALAQPDTALAKLKLISDADNEWLREVTNGEQFDTPPATLAGLIEHQVAASPNAVAVVYEGRHYRYAEINRAANQVAHWLIEQGIGPEDRVAVLLDKSPELIITALGVAKAGAVYLPADPTYPPERLSFILEDGAAKLVLREPPQKLADLTSYRTDNPTDADRVRPLTPQNTAYLIYTSGTTGTPKGVPVPNRPIAEYFVWFKQDYRVDAADRMLQVASPSFDVSIAEVFGMLACGARIVVHKPGGLNDIGYLTDLLRDEGITAMHFVPSLLGLFLSLPGVNQWRTLRRVPIGGEPLPGEVADKFHATFDALLHNFYGPTETVVNASRYKVEGKQGTRIVPIGKPKINTSMHLLDDALQPVPVGVIGEIYIGGSHVAHGYHRRAGLTAERFVADPFTVGGRLYRSGDLARRNADGDIEFVGRADEQVKIRGFRIELGDVAAAISVDPSVGQAVVLVSDLPRLGKSLVGYLTPVAGQQPEDIDVDRIRTRVAAALPEYMVPAGYVVLDEIPITTHGKIDRGALPEPQISSTIEYREPATATERQLAAVFAELLGRDRVGADDSFFDLGGHSLLATKLVAAVRSSCGVEIGVREVFEFQTLAELAGHIDGLATATAADSVTRPRLRPTEQQGPAPLSASQLRSWFSYRIEGPSPVSNIPFAARLNGPVDVAALTAAIGDVVDRHEILRTSYREIDAVPHQIVHPPAGLAVRTEVGPDVEWALAELDVERRHAFDLEAEWPIRAAVLQVPGQASPAATFVSLLVHHIAGDHWSAEVLFTDLLTAYLARRAGQPPQWSALPVQYRDFGRWQGELLAAEAGIAQPQRDYWRSQLAGAPDETGLRPDFARPPVPSGVADTVEFAVDEVTRDKLVSLARELQITEFMLLQAAVAVTLSRSGSGEDVLVGTPVAGRTESELDALIGFFVNILALRNDLSGNPTLREILIRSRDMALSAYQHQDLPFDQVVDAVKPARTLARNPLFQVVVHVRDGVPQDRVIDGGAAGASDVTTFTALEPDFDAAHADLSLNFFGTAAGYRGHLMYRPELYRRSTVQRFTGWLGRVIAAIAEDPDRRLREVAIDDADERHRILTHGGDVVLLDDTLAPVPVGVVGDLYVGGVLAQGRRDGARATAERLVANPVTGIAGSRLYRTGERARWDDDGQLEYIDAEARLTASAAVGSVEVAAVEQPYAEPVTDTERLLANLLTDLLGTEAAIGRHDDFFTLGGDSILAVQLAARARDAGVTVNARTVFEHPVLADLAEAIDAGGAEGGGDAAADTHHAPMTASGLSEDDLTALTASWAQSQNGSQ